jgi:hypothetical protein
MSRHRVSLTIAVLAAIGLVVLAVEAIQTLRGEVLGALGTTLVFLGLGAVIVAGALTIALLHSGEPVADGSEQAPDEEAVPEALVESDS